MSNRRYRNTYLDGCSHFCTASIVEYLPPLTEDKLKKMILDSWNRQRQRWNVLIEGFVIMPEHIHILLRGNADSVRKFMQYSLAETSRGISYLVYYRYRLGEQTAEKWLEIFEKRGNGEASYKVWKERFRCVALDREAAVVVNWNTCT